MLKGRELIVLSYDFIFIPLPANKVRNMAEKVKDMQFSRLYNAFHGVVEDADKAVQKIC
ncbi:TPA: hypothetical protein ACJMKJ_003265 [Bacillus wiedmannii]